MTLEYCQLIYKLAYIDTTLTIIRERNEVSANE